ncbi:MAG TPA: glycosyltransferase [Hyphomicrobiales bacterium]|nr:glycosyltransferase [Hyphomicrobiales bacterium]
MALATPHAPFASDHAIAREPARRDPPALHPRSDSRRIAVVHDWCPNFRGGERVLAEICKTFAKVEIFTLFDFLPQEIKDEYFRGLTFHTSIAARIPFVRRFYRALFFAGPILIEQFDVTGFDAVISSSAAFSRGVLTRPDQPHLCYVHSPVRYAWDEQFSYLGDAGLGAGLRSALYRYLLHRLRTWDARTANGPDLMLANSTYVRARIRRVYGRESRVVFPPVEVERLPLTEDKDDYYVTASYLAPYKRTDLVIAAFNAMPNRRLVVVGAGQQAAALRRMAGPNVRFAGFLPRADYVETVARARAMVFAGCEDFGIALAEAQACGTPLIAFGRGGARDIVRRLGATEMPTGVAFDRQSADAVVEAVGLFEANRSSFRPETCRRNAERFSADRFRREVAWGLEAAAAMNRA